MTRGIYYYPKQDEVIGLGILYPSIEETTDSIARRDKTRIVLTGIHVLNELGLSTQTPMNFIYFTYGTSQKVNIENGKSIQFRFTSPKNLALIKNLAMLVAFVLKEFGQNRITDSPTQPDIAE